MENFKLAIAARLLLVFGIYQALWSTDRKVLADLMQKKIVYAPGLLGAIEEPSIVPSTHNLSSAFAGVAATASSDSILMSGESLDSRVIDNVEASFSDEESDDEKKGEDVLKKIERKALEGDFRYQALLKGLIGGK